MLESLNKANSEATERMMEARPVLVGLGKARDVIPDMRDNLGQRKTRRRVMNEIASQIPPRFWEDEEWAYENYAELLNLYPNKWVAIVDKKVVAVSDGSGKILKEARAKTAQDHIAMVFIEDGSHVY